MGRRILLGVSGGIAAYKSAEIVRALTKQGHDVRVVMTDGAQEFITPLTLQVLSQNPVGTHVFDPTYESDIGHIELARWADIVLVAPATANLLARVAQGMADDLLTTVLLATTAPVLFAPAMNTLMYQNPLVQRNLETIQSVDRYRVIPPDSGELACKEVGAGRLPDVERLLEAIDETFCSQLLTGHRVLITAGPTQEYIDPVRFLSNPSTGKMGYALALMARRMGAKQVVLISGPTTLPTPDGIQQIDVTSAQQMYDAVMQQPLDSMDYVVLTAAVADWRPAQAHEHKQPKNTMQSTLELVRNPDILQSLGEQFGPGKLPPNATGPVLVGFAAESHDVAARGQAKLARKNAHLLVANQVGGQKSAFGADQSSVIIMTPGQKTPIGPLPKTTLAYHIWEHAAAYRAHSMQE